ncbi:MAG: Rop family plasmid primer RNA-binding protein, partial [Gammaproteobacteria bacterium]|nr:Rop family plasmid primer RNA-binding protein [Gammaproteobacteria bacterium]
MAKLSPEQRIANMSGFIKRQSVELLYKLNQLPSLDSGELIHLTEKLCILPVPMLSPKQPIGR